MAPARGPFFFVTRLTAFFDESGDLGWKLEAPYRAGGSSRYFVIACAIGPGKVHRGLGKVIKKLRDLQGWTSHAEKKWANISLGAKQNFCILAAQYAQANPDTHLAVSLIEKQKVPPRLRMDQHLIYAHLATQLIAERLERCDQAEICPDELNTGQGASNLLQHLVRHEVWFRRGCSPDIRQVVRQKHFEQALEFCDMLAGAAAGHFEHGVSEPWKTLQPHVTVRMGC